LHEARDKKAVTGCKVTGANMKENTRRILELFVEKADKLKSFGFDEHVKSVGLGFKATRTDNNDWTIEFGLPDEKERDAFLLTFRLFYQRNESISITNINQLATDPDLSEQWRKGVAVAQKAYSDYLEGYSDYSVQLFDGHPTRGEMFETVLYGSLAHANQPKRERNSRRGHVTTSVPIYCNKSLQPCLSAS
jgi:hypothetical protein